MRRSVFVFLMFSIVICVFLLVFQNIGVEQALSTTQESQYIFNDEGLEDKSKLQVNEILLPMENSEFRTSPITHVMIHYMSNALEKPEDPYRMEDIYKLFLQNGVSTHYVIDRDGNFYRLVSAERVAYHAGSGSLDAFPSYEDKMNHFSIGIELLAIGTREEMAPIITEEKYDSVHSSNIGFTDAQYRSLKELLTDIDKRHPNIHWNRKHIIGHNEYAPERKADPGKLFDWEKLNLK
ncbi:N-acetylmuramoyl-L-alanine amidase [Ornithinibacillus sp. L9]|uniref:N-acetylmuramoyl-L-alanine amidase n=1 Tax=Ornithinibacillus caprae TaxID=2678566 RepID=A0A6N8FG23_9BACI|nr:N-acetylmuramoyl-L-alanine amidase [Ornithinibacillus caprae]MUK88395.1 N-acetylmuramoyl-L-alanine amidase [Ornithinibacillus caprae]